jgi:hypothetical protein
VRIFRERIDSIRKLHPRVGHWGVDLWDGCDAGRATVVTRHGENATVR